MHLGRNIFGFQDRLTGPVFSKERRLLLHQFQHAFHHQHAYRFIAIPLFKCRQPFERDDVFAHAAQRLVTMNALWDASREWIKRLTSKFFASAARTDIRKNPSSLTIPDRAALHDRFEDVENRLGFLHGISP